MRACLGCDLLPHERAVKCHRVPKCHRVSHGGSSSHPSFDLFCRLVSFKRNFLIPVNSRQHPCSAGKRHAPMTLRHGRAAEVCVPASEALNKKINVKTWSPLAAFAGNCLRWKVPLLESARTHKAHARRKSRRHRNKHSALRMALPPSCAASTSTISAMASS